MQQTNMSTTKDWTGGTNSVDPFKFYWVPTPLPQPLLPVVYPVYPAPGICPGCGRCKECGRPNVTITYGNLMSQ